MSLEQPAPLIDVHEYLAMAERGEIAPDARVELLEGEIVDMVPPGDAHFSSTLAIQQALFKALGSEGIVICQMPLRLSNTSQPIPDVAVLRQREERYRVLPHAEDVLLVVEVSESSLSIDRRRKMRIYANAGIPEYWIMNLQAKVLEVYTHPDPASDAYRVRSEARPGEVVRCAAYPQTPFPVADFMP